MIPSRRHPEYFDYPAVAAQAQLAETDLAKIEARVRADYPTDQMMFELRMLRTCTAIRSGTTTLADALKPDPKADASGQAAA